MGKRRPAVQKKRPKYERTRINQQITAPELRVVGAEGENLGILSKEEALARAQEAELDLIEVAGKAEPPVAKIADHGKHQYDQKKKQREIKAKSQTTETKGVQVKIGTSTHDLELKAKRAAEWIKEGDRVKVDLFLKGRSKYKEFDFLKERLERFLRMIPAEYAVADEIKKSPKGLSTIIQPPAGKTY